MLKVIQVGVGGYGGSWLPTIMENDGVEHAALVDMNPAHLSRARETTGLAEGLCLSDVEKAIAAVEADALLCVVPPAHHEAVIGAGRIGAAYSRLSCRKRPGVYDRAEGAFSSVGAQISRDRHRR